MNTSHKLFLSSALVLGTLVSLSPLTFAQDEQASPVDGRPQMEHPFGFEKADFMGRGGFEGEAHEMDKRFGKGHRKGGHKEGLGKQGVVQDIIFDQYLTEDEKSFIDQEKAKLKDIREKYQVQIEATTDESERRDLMKAEREEIKAVMKEGKDQREAIKTRLEDAGVRDEIKAKIEANKDQIDQIRQGFQEQIKQLQDQMKEQIKALLSQS